MKVRKFKFKKITNFLKCLPEFLAKHSFFTILLLLAASLVIGFSVYYKYGLNLNFSAAGEEKMPVFDGQKLKNVISEWQEREEARKLIESEIFKNPFQPPKSETIETEEESTP